ncbi:hypothetical protein [Rubellicoccus peritrichatus]|uniref:Uncharacterized protein n=1 Tax=Rubellicoccus peritrichatus TaxID=3080537 RepID=A0AAQ3QVV7_9BACT|nr:hypothetical protein [Puniceicoccus sp. CR14]WOO43711.1 hypothetical protein RZN69_11485 [Puniceicoccus sp. CR14]
MIKLSLNFAIFAIALIPCLSSAITLNTPADLINEFPRMARVDQFVQANIAGDECLVFQGVNTVVARANTPLRNEKRVTTSIDFSLTQGANSVGLMITGFGGDTQSAVALVNTYPKGAPRLTLYFGTQPNVSLPENAITIRNLDLEYGMWHRLTLVYMNGGIYARVISLPKNARQDNSATLPILELSLPEAPTEDWEPANVALRFYRATQNIKDQVAVRSVSFNEKQ